MIQRKQTLYLFIAGLLPLILLFIPFGDIYSKADIAYKYTAFSVHDITPDKTFTISTVGNAVLLIASSVLSFITIFLYKNRKTQMKLLSLNMLVILLAICTIMYIYPNLIFPETLKSAQFKWDPVLLISFVSAIGLYLSKKAIAKDEAMVRSADRLR